MLKEIAEKMVAMNATEEPGTLADPGTFKLIWRQGKPNYCKTVANRKLDITQRATE